MGSTRTDVEIRTDDGICPASVFRPASGAGPWPGVIVYMDGAGSPTFESSGTEDFFHSSNYFEGTFTNSCFDYVGIPFKSGVTWNAYRFFIMDPFFFQNALKVTWNAGDSSEINFSGGVRLAYCVLYYTEG